MWTSIGLIIEHCRPRVIVFEQAEGIRDAQHREVFQAWIRELTSKGYSARWSILNAAQYGHVHKRKRVFIIASCPGEPLPLFPRPTHGPGLRDWVTIADRLELLPRYQETHMQLYTSKKGRPYDRHTVLTQCITTNGGLGNLHPCGTRTFTIQELALLQGFDAGHLFAMTHMGKLRQQIGNAVALAVERAILEEVIVSMHAFDTTVAAWRPEDEVMNVD
jgi:DNA (cytosine-5)-methyltransferase 1